MVFEITETDIRRIHKKDLMDFLKISDKKLKVRDILSIISDKMKNEKDFRQLFLNYFNTELGVIAKTVEETLNCSRAERIQWHKEGKLPIIGRYSTQTRRGFKIEPYLYNRIELEKITQEDIALWREARKKVISPEKKKEIAAKIKKTKEHNTQLRKNNESQINNMFSIWEKKTDVIGIHVIKLMFWTTLINRWAKHYQMHKRIKNNIKKSKHLYNLKFQAIKLMLNTDKVKVSFYKSDNPDKGYWTCDFKEMNNDESYFSPYYNECPYYYTSCKDCEQNYFKILEEGYYNLYYIELNIDSIKDCKCSYHVPYPLGKDVFSEPNILSTVNHLENETSMFRFGRTLNEDEYVLYTESHILKEFNKAYNDLEKLLKKESDNNVN